MRIVPADFEARRAALRASRAGVSADPQQEHRKPSRIIAEQRAVIAELEGLVEILKGALAAAGGQAELPDYRPWMEGLTPQERAVLGALYRCYPRPLDKEALLDLMPGQDHVEERSPQLVVVKVCHLRRKLGAEAIEHVSGLGYRLGREQRAAMRQSEVPTPLTLAA